MKGTVIYMTKKQIRGYQINLRDGLDQDTRMRFYREIRQRLFDMEEYQSCTSIFTFISFRSEVDTVQIIEHSLKNDKKVYVPRVEQQGMEFYEITDLNGLIQSKFGIPEPPVEESRRYILQKERIQEEHIQNEQKSTGHRNLMLLPGLAFDRYGNRIGYGAGYYDRYLAEHMEADFYKVALAYGFQVMDQIPAEEFDIKADAIITPDELIRCKTVI